MRIFDIAFKDLLQILRDRKSAIFLVVMPVLFTLIMGSLLRGSGEPTRQPVGLLDGDQGGSFSVELRKWLEGSDLVTPVHLDESEAGQVDQRVKDGKYLAAILIPSDFSARIAAGEYIPINIVLPEDPSAGQAASAYLQTGIKHLLSSLEIARLSVQVRQEREPFPDDASRQAYLSEGISLAGDAWQAPDLSLTTESASALPTAGSQAPSGFVQASSGMLVQFSVFSLILSAMVLVIERKTKTLQRALTTPLTRVELVAGHLLAMFLVSFLQGSLLVLLGQLAFGVDYFREPLGTFLLVAALSLWVACLGLLIGALTHSEDQVVLIALIAMFLFTALGGAWFPLEIAGEGFARVGHLLPTAWAMDGLQNIILRGLGLGSVLLPVGILLAYALAFFGVAVWRFKFQ